MPFKAFTLAGFLAGVAALPAQNLSTTQTPAPAETPPRRVTVDLFNSPHALEGIFWRYDPAAGPPAPLPWYDVNNSPPWASWPDRRPPPSDATETPATPPSHPAPGPVSPAETRTPAQLQAMLDAYLGRWQGEYRVLAANGQTLFLLNIDVEYVRAQENGHPVLRRTSSYEIRGQQKTDGAILWVANDRIESATVAPSREEKYFAIVRDESLVWFTEDILQNGLDYYMVEKLRLTTAGDELSIHGFERVPNTNPPELAFIFSELHRVAGP